MSQKLSQDIIKSVADNATPESLQGGMKAVFGRPHRFLESTDPGMRTFTRHMLPAAPLVMIRPGRVKFSEDTTDWLEKQLASFGRSTDEAKAMLQRASSRDQTGGLFGSEYGVDDTQKAAIQQAIREKERGSVSSLMSPDRGSNLKSARYFEFDTSQDVIRQYQSVMYTLASRLFSRMENRAITLGSILGGKWGPAQMVDGGFYTYWADNATSVSESASNEVGATKLAGLVKGVSDVSREVQFFLSKNLSAEEIAKEKGGVVEGAVRGVADFLGGDAKDGSLQASLGDAILGMNPMFPEVWKDSSFSRSYTLNFKFHSPYGNDASVYQNVLLPFIMLMSLVMPVAASPGTYTEPFVFQLDCPGYFACDLGICTDFSFTKGGSENLWTANGLPRQIDVNMSVKDLYPVLVASRNSEALYFNPGMGVFLDNLAGVPLFKTKDGRGDLIARMKASAYRSYNMVVGTPGRWGAGIQQLEEQYSPGPVISRLFGDG